MGDENVTKTKPSEKAGDPIQPMRDAAMEMRASVVSIGKAKSDSLLSTVKDPFEQRYVPTDEDGIIQPAYNPAVLVATVEISGPLNSLVNAMATNVDGYGWELKHPDEMKEDLQKKELPAEAEQEKQEINNLFKYINPDEDFTTLRKKMRVDRHSSGTGYFEVVENMEGDITEMYLIPGFSVRMTNKEFNPTQFEQPTRDITGKYTNTIKNKRFRKYVQMINGKDEVYFKEFWDPRDMHYATGETFPAGTLPVEQRANRILPFPIYSSASAYGIPLWTGYLMNVYGARKANEVNFLYFDNKAIPPMIVMVSGGELTGESKKQLQDLLGKEIKGTENFHKIIIIDAIPTSVGSIEGEKIAPVRIEIKPLVEFIQEDALFLKYLETNRKDLASAFRLPPVYTGHSDDYTRATVAEAARLAEEQVFEPERREFDSIINRTVMASLEINFWEFHSLGAKTSDDAEILKAMSTVKEGIPLGIIIEAIADLRNIPVPDFPEEWRNIPLGLIGTLARGAAGDEEGNSEGGPNDDETDLEKASRGIEMLVNLKAKLEKDGWKSVEVNYEED